MTLSDREKELQEELARVRKEIGNCKHEWGPTAYDPEIVNEPYGYKLVGHGSDAWGEPTGYREVKKDRWSQACTKCGYKRYTKEQKAVKFEPKFN